GGGVAAGRLRLVERRADRREHVRAGVAVRDGKHIQRVDLVDVRLEVRDGAPDRVEEAGPRAVGPRHQATSVPLAARSSGAIVGAASPRRAPRRRPELAAGPAARVSTGPVVRPSTWIVSRATSRPSARWIA